MHVMTENERLVGTRPLSLNHQPFHYAMIESDALEINQWSYCFKFPVTCVKYWNDLDAVFGLG